VHHWRVTGELLPSILESLLRVRSSFTNVGIERGKFRFSRGSIFGSGSLPSLVEIVIYFNRSISLPKLNRCNSVPAGGVLLRHPGVRFSGTVGGKVLAGRERPSAMCAVALLHSPANHVLGNPFGGVFYGCEELGVRLLFQSGSLWGISRWPEVARWSGIAYRGCRVRPGRFWS
jgi:hypothetical protein